MAVAAPATAAAPIPDRFFGAGAVREPTPAQFEQARRGGVSSMRIQFFWGTVEPAPGVRRWQELDQLVRNASTANVELLPVLLGVPPWVSAVPARPPIHTAASREAWVRFVADAAARYGTNGTFWTLNPSVPKLPVRFWQVWNEVNLSGFWGGPPNVSGYADLLRLTRGGLLAGDPAAKVILSGVLPFKSRGGSIDGTTYMRKLVRRRSARGQYDVAAIHPYGQKPGQVMSYLEEFGRMLRRSPARSARVWVTEFGWATGGRGWRKSPVRATKRQQARRVSATYRLMVKRRKALKIDRAYYFSFADYDIPNRAEDWTARLGLFDLSGKPKRAWFSYVRRAGGTP